jgi:hypothetical protein
MIPSGFGVREIVIAQITIPLLVILLMNADSGLTEPDAEKLAVVYALVVAGVQRGISIIAELVISAILCRSRN